MNRRKSPLDAAYLKGIQAQLEGADISTCPYKDKRKWDGRLTFSRAFLNAWRDGWEYAEKNRDQALISIRYAEFARRPKKKTP